MNRSVHAILLAFVATAALIAQDEPAAPAAGAAGGRGGGTAAQGTPNPQPYDRVITKEAKSKKGLFTVHQIGERFFYEIPKKELGKQYLWTSRIARTTLGAGYGGGQLTEKVVMWELRNNRVYLSDVDFSIAADPDSPIAMAVKFANNDTILMSFNVAAFHDGDPVIDVSRLFNTDVPEFSARQRMGQRLLMPRAPLSITFLPTPITSSRKLQQLTRVAVPDVVELLRQPPDAAQQCVATVPAWCCTTVWCACRKNR